MQNKNNNKKRKRKRVPQNIVIALASIFIIIGGFFLSYNYIQSKKIKAYDYMANVFYEDTTKENKEDKEKKNNKQPETIPQTENTTTGYIGYLEISKINLNKGFYDITSSENENTLQVPLLLMSWDTRQIRMAPQVLKPQKMTLLKAPAIMLHGLMFSIPLQGTIQQAMMSSSL